MAATPDSTGVYPRRWLHEYRYRVLAGVLALGAGLAVLLLAHELFPYHSSNHDEGVYLQQAAMLLDGRLYLTPGSDALREAVHPWFFVESDQGFYSKYAPVPAAIFALGQLLGGYRVALLVVAATVVGATYVIVAAAFDRPTGVIAAAILAGAPLFLLTSAVFLPYAPTTALNLVFAAAYIRSVRHGDWRSSVIAGVAIGLAFFARPYTAVLFATPFVVHAAWRLGRDGPTDRKTVRRTGTIAGIGLVFVAVTLAYNAFLTGSPFRFPYEAFAPHDGLGFGRREILGYGREYTPSVALQTTLTVLRAFAETWFTAGLLGTVAAGLGAGIVLRGIRREGLAPTTALSDNQLRVILLGVAASVILGNAYFWGSLNILGDPGRPGDGLISLFGPFYHFDLLLPAAAFAAHGTVTVGRWARTRWGDEGRPSRLTRVGIGVLLVTAIGAVGAAEATALQPPIERNAAYTAKFAAADAPLQSAEFDDAIVFIPPEYGEWRNHPFQWRRNDPDLDGPALYLLSRTPAADFAVLEAYPDRTVYRYRYHGEWTPDAANHVVPVLDKLERIEARSLTARTTVTIPERIVQVRIGMHVDGSSVRYRYSGDPPDRLDVTWAITRDGLTVVTPDLERLSGSSGPVPIDAPTTAAVTVTISEPSGTTLTYRETVLVRPTAAGIEAMWPPSSTACLLVEDCGLEGTYIPDRPDTRPTGIAMNTTLVQHEAIP